MKSKLNLERALEHAFTEAYTKTMSGWEAKIYSENWKSFIKDEFFRALEELEKEGK